MESSCPVFQGFLKPHGLWVPDLPGKHIPEQIHIPGRGDVPAEVLLHFPLLQGTEAIAVAVVQIQAPLQGGEEIVGIVALEGEAQTALAVFIGGRHGILQAAGGVDHGNGAVTHGVHLAQAAGLGLGGHQVDVAAGVDPGGQP